MGVVMIDSTPNQAATESPPIAIRLSDGLRFIPQQGSREWRCVIEAPASRQFFRVGRREYLVASALDGKSNLASLCSKLNESNPELSIDAKTIEQTIRWLISSGLAQPINREANAENSTPAKAATKASLPIDPFMFRVPILNGRNLESLTSRLSFLSTKPFGIASFIVLVAGIGKFIADSGFYTELGVKLFVPSAALWWISAWFMLKVVHELGHAVVCVGFGGQLRGAGIASFYFAPVPYVDTTDMWRLPNRRARAYCAAAGMWFEMLLAAIAVLICGMVESPSIQYFCVTIATLGTFTTLAFNANPLVRFDGYYILSDALDWPTLWTDGQNALRSLWGDTSFQWSSTLSIYGAPLLAYGIACLFNRILIMVGLAWGAWVTYQGIGLGLIALASYLWYIAPMLRKRKMLQSQAALALAKGGPSGQVSNLRRSLRRWGTAIVGLSALTVISMFVPSPMQPLSPGYLSYGDSIVLRPESDGIVTEIFNTNDMLIEAGKPIVRLENPTLQLEHEKLNVNHKIAKERCLVLRAQSRMSELQAEQARVEAIHQQLAQVKTQLEQLLIKAPKSGRLIENKLSNTLGQLAKVGQPIATIATSQALEVRCSVSQSDVEAFREHVGKTIEIYFANEQKVMGRLTEVRPRGADILDNPALAAKYGGPITVHMTTDSKEKENPLKTEVPRFEARVSIEDLTDGTSLTAGQICRVGLVDRQMSIADILSRWKNAFIEWLRPVDAKA